MTGMTQVQTDEPSALRPAPGVRALAGIRGAGLIAVLAAVIGISGCGSSSSSSSTSQSNASGSAIAAALKRPPIKVAFLVDKTGPQNGGQGATAAVINAWASAANAAGGIAGHPVDIEVTDTMGNPSTAAADAQSVISDPSVSAVVIVDAAADAAAAVPLSKAGVPVVGGNGFNPAVWGAAPGNRYATIPQLKGVFGVTTAFPANATPFVMEPKAAGLRNIAAIGEEQNPSSKQATELVAAMSRALGLTFKAGLSIDATAPNFTAQCLALVQAHVQYVALTMPDTTAKILASNCKTEGYTGAFGASAALVTPLFYGSLTGSRLLGGLTGFPWFVDAPPVKQYRDDMAKYGVPSSDWARPDSTAVWATMELFKHALAANASKLGNSVTRADVLAAYYTIKNVTLGGLLPGPVTYTAGHAASAPKCFWLYSYENGNFSGDYKPTCPAPQLGAG
jgi:branched-chain amino acid transport system substrate-binding protein